MDILTALNALTSSFISAIVTWALALYFLPKFLRLIRLEGRMYDNTLSLINAALISYFIVFFLIVPIASDSLPFAREVVLPLGVLVAAYKLVSHYRSSRTS